MIFTTLARPLIGAVIGDCTNYIAVKMLFRPLRPVSLFGRTLPFTPGIIPKGQARLARAAGSVVGQELLTQEELEKSLLSEEMEERIRSGAERLLQEQAQNEQPLEQLLTASMGQEPYQMERETLYRDVTDHLTEKLANMNLGETIAEQALVAVKEKIRGTLLAMMVSDEMLDGFAQPVASQINQYVRDNGDMLLAPAVCEEMEELEQCTVGALTRRLRESAVDVPELAVRLYRALVGTRLPDILAAVDVAGIAERRVASLEPEELEKLVLSVMKKELNAVVNLGALIGFVLGLINLLF